MHLEPECGLQLESSYTAEGHFLGGGGQGEEQSQHYLAARNYAKAFSVPSRVKTNKVYYEPNMLLKVLRILTI